MWKLSDLWEEQDCCSQILKVLILREISIDRFVYQLD